MSVTVQQLTEDGTFVMTFAPSFAPSKSAKQFPGAFTILIDPWLDGESVIFHSKFAVTQHTTRPSISSLAEIQNEIDLILITQEKADHLHKETLCTLSKNSNIPIVAPPKAAKFILSWNHFTNPGIVRVLDTYNEKKPDSVMRIPIDPYSSASAEGEVTIANIPQKKDLVGIHNAIGITYCPPGTLLMAPDGKTVNIAEMPMMSPSSGASPSPNPPTSSRSGRKRYLKGCLDEVEWIKQAGDITLDEDTYDATKPRERVIRADSPLRRPSTSCSRAPSIKSVAKRQDNFEKVLSVVYTPHGTDADSLQPYARSHLSVVENGLPITMLVHGLNFETNPWWMGGVVCAGAPGGMKIAQKIGVKYWLGAHDELKESDGIATKLIKAKRHNVEEVTKMLREAEGLGRGSAIGTEVVALRAGEKRRFKG